MSTKTWSAAGAGNWSTGANWSGGTAPADGDDVVFDGTSVQNCTVDAATNYLNTIRVTSAYSGTITMNAEIKLRSAASATLIIDIATTTSFAGASAIRSTYVAAGTANFTVSALNLGVRPLILESITASAVTYTLTGNITVGTTGTTYLLKGSTGAYTFNSGGYSITCGTLQIGNSVATGEATFNFGASTLSMAYSFNASSYATGVNNINLQTCQMSVGNNISFPANGVVNPGTSVVTCTGTGSITMNGKSLYSVVVNSSGFTRTMADSLSCCCLTRTAGVLTFSAGANLTLSGASGLVIAAVGGNCTFQNITFSAAGAAFTQNGTGTVSAQTVTFSDSANITIGSATTFNKLVCTDGKTYNWSGAGVLTVTTNAAGDWSGSAGAYVTWVGPGKIKAPAGVSVSYMNVTNMDNSTGVLIDAIDPSNFDGGGNINWTFPVRPAGSYRKVSRLSLVLSASM